MRKPLPFAAAAIATVSLAALALVGASRSAGKQEQKPTLPVVDLSGPEPIFLAHHRRGVPVFSVYQY